VRVAVLTHTYFPIVGGAEVGIHEIYRRFDGDDVTIVTPIPADYVDAFVAPDHETTVPYSVLRYKGFEPNFRSARARKFARLLGWREFRVIARLHRQRPLDAVNVHFLQPFGLAALWIRLFLRVPVYLSLIGRTDVWSALSPMMRRHARVVLWAANGFEQISEFCLEGSPYADGTVIPYGVDSARYRPDLRREKRRSELAAPGQTILLTAQRLDHVKRVDVLLDVARRLDETAPGEFVLVVVGKGIMSESLQQKITDDGIRNVVMYGFASEDELPEIYASADIFVSHSMFETFGVMFAEAMASGLPIVAARTSCIPQVVTDGENGTLVEPFDIEAFVRGLRELRQSADERAVIAERNRQKALTRFNWNMISQSFRSMLRGDGD
jgi:glycosyltransferase involved in cell wall biosynthesis